MPNKPVAIRTITAAEMRAVNRTAILELIRRSDPISRTEIAHRLGVSLPTVMRIVDSLVAEDLVQLTSLKEWSGGRKRPLLEFNGSKHLVIGIDLGGTKVYGAVADLCGHIIYETNFNHQQTQSEASFQVLCQVIDQLITQAEATGLVVRGIGIGVPGITHPEIGVVDIAPSLDWIHFPLKDRLSQCYPLPIEIENDVNLAALGELWYGGEDSVANLVLIAIGTGIGAGVVINGMVYTGSHSMAGEIGYLIPDRSSLGHSYPGFGALEQLASGTGIAARARQRLAGQWEAGPLEALSAEDVFSAARLQAPWALEVIAETVDYLAQAIGAVSLTLDPDVILLGGGVAGSADLLIEPILHRLQGVVPALPVLKASQLGYRAAVMGAIVKLLRVTTNYYIFQKYA